MSSNSFLKHTGPGRFLNRSLALFLALVLLFALLPGLEPKADAAYYDDAIQKLIGWNVLRGYPDGNLNPDDNITRAEFVALINRAYGYSELKAIPFIDVAGDAWYHDDISAAYAAGYFNGATPVTAEPSGALTREQALVLLARNMRLDVSGGEVTSFSDGHAFQSYSAGYANAAVQKGLVSGYGDGSFRPGSSITRGEMAVMLSRALGNLINSAGIYALGSVFGNVTIDTTNVTLRDTTIAGDLYLTGGLGLGGVTLENVKVLGDIIVAGGGESDEGESVILRNVTADNVLVDTLLGEYVSLRAEGDTNIGRALLVSDAYLQDRTPAGLGFRTIEMAGAGGSYTLSGNLEKVVNAAPGSVLRISQGIVKDLTMDEAAAGSSLWLDSNATVHNLTLDTAATVTGQGDVRKLNVNVAGSSTEMLPDEIEIRPGLTGSVAGETMDTTAAAEASSEPRILANYPNVINVAATTATATFSTNKSGTLYWAITTLSDGSVTAEALLTPAAEARILRSGSLRAERSNTTYSANITGLTSGGSYYLTAMLVDARGDYSPIKVASFTTTDNSTPAFGSGHPYMSLIEKTYAEVTVMATKSCQLYWVVFDKGSASPTAASFRAGAFSGAYGYGVMDVQRNITETFRVNNLENLEELKSYDLYLWLNDADSAKSSAVRKLSFTTPDKTPPVFNLEPTMTTNTATSIRLTTNVNEAGTVYWVIVEDGEDYPRQPTTSIKDGPLDSAKEAKYKEYFRLQIVSGMNGLKSGSVKVKANTDATINITGLAAETRYRVYFIAVDNAGNYSVFPDGGIVSWSNGDQNGYKLISNYVTVSTKDEKEPTVEQRFTSPSASGPRVDTAIQFRFSEPVERYSTHRPLEEVYAAVENAEDKGAEMAAREVWAELLRNVIKMFSGTSQVKERTKDTPANSDDWVIDYRYAALSKVREGGRLIMIVTFPTVLDAAKKPTAESALNLNSDASYYFRVYDIADTSADENEMVYDDGEIFFSLDPFTTRAAEVGLKYEDVPSVTITRKGEDGKETAEEIPIKLAYSMTPDSVTKSNPDRRWDMLIFSDETITFELYMQTQENKEGATWDPNAWELVKTVDGGTALGSVSVNANDKKAGDFKSCSFWKHIRGAAVNPFIRDEFNIVGDAADAEPDADAGEEPGAEPGEGPAEEPAARELYGLDDNKIYFFAIHIIAVNNIPVEERDDEVKFNLKITVDTGSSGDFSEFLGTKDNPKTMTSNPETGNGNYDLAIKSDSKPYRLSEISENINYPGDDFLWPISYPEKKAPDFADGYPRLDLEVTDTRLKGELKLNREGTVWYFVAPAESNMGKRLYRSVPVDADGNRYYYDEATGEYKPTADPADGAKLLEYAAGSTIQHADLDVPISGSSYDTGARPDGTADAYGASMVYFYEKDSDTPINSESGKEDGLWYWLPLYVTEPSTDFVSNYNDNTYKYNPVPVKLNGTSPEKFEISDLDYDTEYFIYFMIEGSSMESDYVQVYKFRTDKIHRPDVKVSKPDDQHVDITNSSKSASSTVDIEYGLFYWMYLTGTELDKDFFEVACDAAGKQRYQEDLAANRISAQLKAKIESDSGYTVMDALQDGLTDYESLFDRYASWSYKQTIRGLVTGDNPVSYCKGMRSLTGMAWNQSKRIDCFTEFSIDDTNRYFFLAVSHYSDAVEPGPNDGIEAYENYYNSFSFRGREPIQNRIVRDPQITSVGGNVTVTYKEVAGKMEPSYDGYIILNFLDDLYYEDGTTDRPRIYQSYKKNGDPGYKYRLVTALLDPGTDLKMAITPVGDANTITNQIYLTIDDDYGQISFKSGTIASQFSNAVEEQITVKVRLGASPDKAGSVLTPEIEISPSSLWTGTNNATVVVYGPEPSSIAFPASFTIQERESKAFTATVNFKEANPQQSTVEWKVIYGAEYLEIAGSDKSSPKSIDTATRKVHVHEQTLTGLAAGTAVIQVTCGRLTAEYSIEVTAPPAPENASLTETAFTMTEDETLDLKKYMNISAVELEKMEIYWTTSNTDVATVSSHIMGNSEGGLVTGIKAGKATITAAITPASGGLPTILTADITVVHART